MGDPRLDAALATFFQQGAGGLHTGQGGQHPVADAVYFGVESTELGEYSRLAPGGDVLAGEFHRHFPRSGHCLIDRGVPGLRRRAGRKAHALIVCQYPKEL